MHVAVDVGTSGGAVVAGWIDDGTLRFEEVSRFDPGRIEAEGRKIWDVDHLRGAILDGLAAAESSHGPIDSVGIDATAGGFGFAAGGELLRDPVREGSALPDGVSRRGAFFATGHRRLPSRYYHAYRESPELVESADHLLLLPALLAGELDAEPHGEVTYAISAGMGNTLTGTWTTDLLEEFGLPTDILPPMASLGETVGTVDALDSAPEIVVVPGHDTSSAVAAIPFGADRAFLATGSWFIPGFEVDEPVVTEEAFRLPAENVGGVDGTARFVRNIPGFSVFEHCRAAWREAGRTHEYGALLDAAASAEPFGPLVDPVADELRSAHAGEDPLGNVRAYCRRTGQRVPDGEGEVARCLFESLATKSALLLDRLADAADRGSPETIRMVGGGVRNPLLGEMIASATDTPVLGGPIEATAIGNLLVQLRASGAIDSIADGRDLVRRSVDVERFEPDGADGWRGARDRLRELEG